MVIFKNIQPQIFQFKSPLMNYIFKNASPELFTKFNKTCKYIFAKFQLIPVKALPYFKETKGNFWLTERFEFERFDQTFFKKWIPRIIRCDLKYFELIDCDTFMFKDFLFLTESGNLELLCIARTTVLAPNNEPVPLEELMNRALKATSIIISPCHVTSETMKILCSKKRHTIMTTFIIGEIDGALDHRLYAEFVMENVCDETDDATSQNEKREEKIKKIRQMLSDQGISDLKRRL